MWLQDGVLWRGQDLISNAVEALHAFRAAGKRLLFVTNNSSKSRQEYVAKFKALGIDVSAQEVRGSSRKGSSSALSVQTWLVPHPHAVLLALQKHPTANAVQS